MESRRDKFFEELSFVWDESSDHSVIQNSILHPEAVESFDVEPCESHISDEGTISMSLLVGWEDLIPSHPSQPASSDCGQFKSPHYNINHAKVDGFISNSCIDIDDYNTFESDSSHQFGAVSVPNDDSCRTRFLTIREAVACAVSSTTKKPVGEGLRIVATPPELRQTNEYERQLKIIMDEIDVYEKSLLPAVP